MRIITISREFGSGGRELGKRLADVLGYDYYDKEIITVIAENQEMGKDNLTTVLNSHAWRSIPLTFCRSFTEADTISSLQTGQLLKQKHVIEEIAKAGQDCIIVGRDADVLLKSYKPFTIFVCAEMEAKIRRCMERASQGENLSPKVVERRIRRVDRDRAYIRDIITDSIWGARGGYHLTINTTDWNIKELTSAVADFANRWFEKSSL